MHRALPEAPTFQILTDQPGIVVTRMTIRLARWTALLALIFTLGAASAAFAFLKGGCVRREESGPVPVSKSYTERGRRGAGFLSPETPHPEWWEQQLEQRNGLFSVSLAPQLPYPNPHSEPVVVVVVEQRADFRIELARTSGRAIDEFDFRDVVPGFYRFTFDLPPRISQKAVVTLLVDGVLVADMTARSAVMKEFP